MAPPRGKYQVKLNSVMFSMLLEELLSGPTTAQAIADYTGMALLTVQRTLRVMHRRGLVHIAAWERDKQKRWGIRVFAFGHGRDAKKPPPRDQSERQRERRARIAMQPLGNLGSPMQC